MTMERVIVGVDCAADDANVGVALARWTEHSCDVQEVRLCGRDCSPTFVIAPWLAAAQTAAIIAIDAPLGWPASLSSALLNHSAGRPLSASADEMFRRSTDRFIKAKLGKTPLDVGADRIARTAYAALLLLEDLRQRLRRPVDLAWQVPCSGIGAVEVYPAATLLAHGFRSFGYKKPEQAAQRREMIEQLQAVLQLPKDRVVLVERSADALDAVVCVLAGKDFLDGQAMAPKDLVLAGREGWIWVRAPRT